MKSIEEESRAVTNEVFKKLVYITSGTGISKEELVELVDLINDTSKKAVNANLEEIDQLVDKIPNNNPAFYKLVELKSLINSLKL